MLTDIVEDQGVLAKYNKDIDWKEIDELSWLLN